MVFKLKNYNLLTLGLDDDHDTVDCAAEPQADSNIKLILQFIEFRV